VSRQAVNRCPARVKCGAVGVAIPAEVLGERSSGEVSCQRADARYASSDVPSSRAAPFEVGWREPIKYARAFIRMQRWLS